FFSSRRRHTRFSRDWSSDVCSSDLGALIALWQRVVKRGLDLFVLTTCFVAAEVGQHMHLDPLLLMLAAGLFIENVLHTGRALRRSEERRVGKEGRSRRSPHD